MTATSMALTKGHGPTPTIAVARAVCILVLSCVCGGILYAQNSPGQLGEEIQRLESQLSATGLSPAERHDAFARLARLRQLSGDIAAAAANWLEAAGADPTDDNAVIAGAYCLAAIGEWEKAAATLRPLLVSGKQGPQVLQARYLEAFLQTQRSGNAAALAGLAANAEFAVMRPTIYYTLWQSLIRNPGISGAGNAESWKSRLLAEFPNSPEARIANQEKQGASASISAVQSPLWLLLPEQTDTNGTNMEFSQSENSNGKAGTALPPLLQTGVFGKEANARAQAEALQKAGFSPLITSRQINGTEHWAVTVPAGQDSKKTAADLKKAGFDSFPVKGY